MSKGINWKIALAILVIAMPEVAKGHIDWTRANDIDPDCIALYHIESNQVQQGMQVGVSAGLSAGRSLVILPPAGVAASVSADVAQSIFFPYSFRFNSIQELRSAELIGSGLNESITEHLSIEARFKWHAGMTSSTLIFGLADGPKLQISYYPGKPDDDRFGIATASGDYRSAPQFINWIPLIEHDGGIGVWSHAGLCIHSTGVSYSTERQSLVYNAGSLARFYVNGHLVGDFSVSALDIAGMAIAETSAIIIQCAAGSHVSFDEFTVWSRDWSDNGEEFSPFRDGRGSGISGVEEWMIY